jgi:hypothetical protein
MEDPLRRFDTMKDVFLLGRMGKKAKDKVNALRTQFVKMLMVDDETHRETWMLSKKRR